MLIIFFSVLIVFVGLIFWYCLPSKDEANINPYS